MRKTVALVMVMVLALGILATGCVQKSEMDKAVADLNAKLKASDDAAKKTKTDLDAANKQIADLKTYQAIADKFSKEVNVWGVTGGKLAAAKVRVAMAAKPEDLIQNALVEALKSTALPTGVKLVKFTVKGTAATVALSTEWSKNWSKDVAAQKLALGVIVNTVADSGLIKTVLVTPAVKIDKTSTTKPLTMNDALFTK